jgi:uncharacterized protein (TIGR03435 family)
MKQVLLYTLLVLFILQGNTAKSEAPKVGETAPPLKLTGLLQASGKLEQNIKSLNGKVVVLEFWATWCAPCIAAMPHLNELSEKYKDKGVQFISITDETTEKANNFLKKRKINGWVGIDGNKAMHDTYGVQSIPFTVVIGPNGKVLGYPKSKELSDEVLAQALSGKELAKPTQIPVSAASNDNFSEPLKPLYELSLRPSASQGMSNRIGPGIFKTTGVPALELIKVAFDAKLKHTEVTAQLPEGKFDVVATNFGDGSPDWEWRTQLQRMLQEVWGIDIRQEQKEMEVYELVSTPTAEKRLVKANPEEIYSQQSSDKGVLAGRNTSIPILVKILQESLPFPIVDASKLKGNYDYNLYYDEGKPESLITSLEKEMGLTLRRVKRPIEVLLVIPKQ